jgi:hypothetical protein
MPEQEKGSELSLLSDDELDNKIKDLGERLGRLSAAQIREMTQHSDMQKSLEKERKTLMEEQEKRSGKK